MPRLNYSISSPLLVIFLLPLMTPGLVRGQAEFRAVPRPLAPWQTDIRRFEGELRRIVAEARVPQRATFERQLKESSGDLEIITDGYGGVVDFDATQGTVQYVANKLVQGRPIEWEFELARDAKTSYDGSIRLNPKLTASRSGVNSATDVPLLAQIKIKDSNAGPFKAGSRVQLKAHLDDFSRFRKGFSSATGLIVVHYLEDAPPAMFRIHLEKAELTLVKRAE